MPPPILAVIKAILKRKQDIYAMEACICYSKQIDTPESAKVGTWLAYICALPGKVIVGQSTTLRSCCS